MKELTIAYKRKNYEEYQGLFQTGLTPILDDYDGEFITAVGKDTTVSIVKHYYQGMFFGYNICANGKVIETRGTLKGARKYLARMVKAINTPVPE